MPAGQFRFRLQRHCCFSTFQLAEKHVAKAKHLLASQKREDAEAALAPIDAALEVCPSSEKALELKACTLLRLQRYKDVVEMLHDYIPSLIPSLTSSVSTFTSAMSAPSPLPMPESPVPKERSPLLSGYNPSRDDFLLLSPIGHCFSVAKLRQRLSVHLSYRKIGKQQQWRYLVLGQACFYLGMLEDAMVLLQSGKRTASAVSRIRSNGLREDNFSAAFDMGGSLSHEGISQVDADKVAQMLGTIKFLLRRRTAAMAALEAGLYAESVRHFSKIIDGRKGSPRRFIADCYLHRAIAYQATGRVVDAIADCNKTLSLNPNCSKALSVRASLYEMVKCYSECLLDLQQLKMMYEAALRYQMLPEPRAWTIRRQQLASDVDLAGRLDYINNKITAARQRLSGSCSLDAHTILDMPKSCTMDDVKRAYTVLSLKHRPDMATNFIGKCELVDDERDMETVREEVRASAHRLSQLIYKAYTKVLSCISEEKEIGMQGIEAQNKSMERRDETPLIEIDDERPKEEFLTEIHEIRHDEKTDLYHPVNCILYDEGRGSAEDETDACDFCQPFGGLTTAALANALSQALLHDAPTAATPATAVAATWTPDWSLALSQPLQVT
ncbi:hypothetical protein GOP47_0016568 [Adiantum capillus-veneris]|uniref:Uncharacterized protein n=1 Tax=Adiantum capillus-veneris TaxID=13818 RepID=A0A9D4UIT8_ADICA|nr:hypothetical protein GOP47_0016568 [Adiantum capillus-veneris]